MPTLSHTQIKDVACRVLRAKGASLEEASMVAEQLAEANLVGHDSHGIIRLQQYVDFIEQGHVKPRAQITLVRDAPSVVVLDGGGNFGQVVATKALEVARQRARAQGAATVFCRNTNHVGRIGSYTRLAALDQFVAIMFVNGPGAAAVAPWGAVDRRYGTNPISIAAPGSDEPIVLDMTTSATAEGKIRVALQKGQNVPEGWIIDQNGKPSTSPNDFYEGGAILPLGGPLGFKGYGLGVMVDLLAGVLSGAGVVRDDVPAGNNGVLLHLIDVRRVIDQEEYDHWMGRYLPWIKSARPADGASEVLLPGEIESKCRQHRITEGISIPEQTWQQTCDVARRVGVEIDLAESAGE